MDLQQRWEKLQWGRAFTNAEIAQAGSAEGPWGIASMGPRFHKRGNGSASDGSSHQNSRASMGPRFHKRGNWPALIA